MLVGILSMQEIKNYGSFLQAFSLKKQIEDLGHTCEFINIIPGEQIGECKIGRFHKLKLLLKRLFGLNFFKRVINIYKYQSRFSKEFLPELQVKEKNVSSKRYDIIVIGSDEVFNCTQKTWFGFSPQLFGENLNSSKIISYAASFGSTTIESLERLGVKNKVAQMLSNNFKSLSVRDYNSLEVVKSLTNVTPEINVDPVIINNWSDEIHQEHIEEVPYMLVYTYPGRITDNEEISYIKKVAKERGLKLISVGHYFSWVDKTVVPHPFEVLAYFRDADCVITDTFHGSIFSIKSHIKFCTIVRDLNKNKLESLLSQFGLSDRIARSPEEILSIIGNDIDYSSVDKLIEFETSKSMEYLKNNLS